MRGLGRRALRLLARWTEAALRARARPRGGGWVGPPPVPAGTREMDRPSSSSGAGGRRLPPGQVLTERWPVLHYGPVPSFDPARWGLEVLGLVETPLRFSYDELGSRPRVRVRADRHCVTTWSRFDMEWEGVSVRELLARARPAPEARFAIVHGEHGYTTNLPLARLADADCLLADAEGGRPLTPEHGFPLRLVVPKLYAWESAKWVRKVELSATDRPGFWEVRGYHNEGDPWAEERYSG